MSKHVQVTFNLTSAWEEWSFEVPDDATEEWVTDNIHKLWDNGTAAMTESGGDQMEIESVVFP